MTEKSEPPMVVGFDIGSGEATALVEMEAGQIVKFYTGPDADAVLRLLKAREDCWRQIRDICGLPK